MKKPAGYDEAETYTGEYEGPGPLPAGLYVCQIKGATTETIKGKEYLVIAFDIIDGDYAGYYQAAYNMDTRDNKKWKGVHRQGTEGSSLPFFKGLIASIEKSNPGYTWNWDENTLKGKKFGAVMGREEFLTQDGQKKMATKIRNIRSIEGLKNATIPEDKLLPDNTAGYPDMPPTGPAPTDADAPFGW